MLKQQFEKEYGKFLDLNNKSWDYPKMSVIGYRTGIIDNVKVKVSLRGEIEKDYLYYLIGGDLYELDLSFLRASILDNTQNELMGIKYTETGNLKAYEIPIKYLQKKEIPIEKENKEDNYKIELLKSIVDIKNLNKLNSFEEFYEELEITFSNIKSIIDSKKKKYKENWDSFIKRISFRKQKSAITIVDSLLDKDLENYYSLLKLLSEGDNLSENKEELKNIEKEINKTLDDLLVYFILQKSLMLKQIRNKIA